MSGFSGLAEVRGLSEQPKPMVDNAPPMKGRPVTGVLDRDMKFSLYRKCPPWDGNTDEKEVNPMLWGNRFILTRDGRWQVDP